MVLLLPTTWTTSLLVLLSVSTGVTGLEHQSMRLVKRDPSGVPATISHQNCATRYWKRFMSNPTTPFCNRGIQIGECFVNARIKNNVFGTFEPDDGPMTASREGGAYGRCCAYNMMPKEEDVIEVKNANYFCFAWQGAGKKIGAGLPSSGLPGMLAWPFPLICPGPHPNCYSLEYFDALKTSSDNIAQHKLVSSADRYPNTTAYWQPPKRPGESIHKRPFLWCNGRGLGCPITTNRLFQTQNLGSMKCNPTKCLPYQGDMTILQGDDRSKYSVVRGSAVADIKSCDAESDPWCGGPRLSGFGEGGSSSRGGTGSGSSRPPTCDTNKDPSCKSAKTTPTKCDKNKDPNCDKSSSATPSPDCDPTTNSNCKSTTLPKCNPLINDNCPQTTPPSTQCDTYGNEKCKKQKKTSQNKKPKKSNCEKDGSCSGYGKGSTTNKSGEQRADALKRNKTESMYDYKTDISKQEQQIGTTKRDKLPCNVFHDEDCQGHSLHKRRRSILKRGWVV